MTSSALLARSGRRATQMPSASYGVELFYYVDEARRKIKVIHACDARSDPRSKFVGVHTADL